MAQTGFTPIQLYYSTTVSAAPTAGNLASGELAINITDGKLFYKDNLGAVQTIAYKTTPVAAGGTGSTSLTANNVLLGNGTSALQTVAPGTNGNVLTSNGTTWTSSAPSFSGTVTSVSVVSANGLAGTVATATTTPAITLSTSVTGILKGNGTAISAAVANTDYVTPTGTVTLTNKTLTDPTLIGTALEDVYTIVDGAAFEVDPGNGSIQLITLGASRTPKATNFVAGEAITLMVDDGTAYTITWTDATWGGSGVVWMTGGGTAPTLNTTGYTTIVLWKVSTQVYGAKVG